MFGEIVKTRRDALGMSLREFCRRLQEDPSNWSKVERGVLRPPLRVEKLRQIASVLDITKGSAEWEGLVDAAVIGAGEIPSYIRENRAVYEALPELFRTIGGASLTAEEIRRMVRRLLESGAGDNADEHAGRKAIVVAGPNGAGKTTFVREYLEARDVKYISADAIAEGMTDGDIRDAALPAGKMFFAELRDAVSSGMSFVVETTLSGRGFRRLLREMRQEGYAVSIVFVYLDKPEFCVTRIRERTRRGGHHVPEEDVVRRYHRSIANFRDAYRLEADDWHLVCNSAQEFVEVARGCGEERLVFDPESYAAFIESEGLSDEE